MQLDSNRSHTIKKERNSFFERLFNFNLSKSRPREELQAQSEEVRELIESINNAKREWERATRNFEYADSQESIDYYTYIIKANEVMYEYLLKKAKEKGLRVEVLETMEVTYNKNMV
ncbi:MAG: YaaL family protein [Clostridia bacterium]|nr:YaaL family protein [Clostridia bacterium]